MAEERSGNAFEHMDPANRMLARVDTDKIGAMAAVDGGGGAPRTNFLPATFADAMELAKLMAAGTFVPARVRNRPGDCLAIVMQATRWGMDPFAVAQKIYFVNNDGIPGYEAQLITAVINTSGVLDGKLHVEWEGEGDKLKCIVTGKLIGDPREKAIEQLLSTITTKNSPLWKQAPRQQLAYFTQRLWARLYAPEVMLGVYAAEELVENGATMRQVPGNERPAAPTRAATAERILDGGRPVDPPHDAETGEIEDEETIARRLDAETQRQAEGGAAEELDDEIPHQDSGEVKTDPGDGIEKTAVTAEAGGGEAAIGPENGKPAEPAKPAIDWESWLGKLSKDMDALGSADDVEKLYASKAAKLADAPDGVKNRARGYRDARLRKLETSPEKPKAQTAAQKRTAAAAAAQVEEKPKEPVKEEPTPEPATENAEEPAADDGVSPATKRADEIIADLGKKELLMDLRSAKAGYDADIDAMDEENAGRVVRAFRALEDKLARKPK